MRGAHRPCAQVIVWMCAQTLHIIRHGESEYNAATNAGKDFKDPQIFNPKLTEKGLRQVHMCLNTPLQGQQIRCRHQLLTL